MSDFLGDEFSAPAGAGSGGDFDFDRAAAAFPDISLDGVGDIPVPAAAPSAAAPGGFSYDDFGSPPMEKVTDVKVTGDDEIEKFEDQFPDIGVPAVSASASPA
jgi:hypothetical protein